MLGLQESFASTIRWGAFFGWCLMSLGCSVLFDFEPRTETTKEKCQNGLDDDADDAIDCRDIACHQAGFCPEASFDSCGSASGQAEGDGDGIDNDGDGLSDCADPSCDGYCYETTTSLCSDGRDNDGDGLSDFEDPGCWGVSPAVQKSCLSSDLVEVAVDLWQPAATLIEAETGSGVIFASAQVFDGNWRDLYIELSLRGQSAQELVAASGFGRLEIALIPSAPGDEIPSNLEENALFYLRLQKGEGLLRVLEEEVSGGEPFQAVRLREGILHIVGAEGEEDAVDLSKVVSDLPTHRPARLFVRVPGREVARALPSKCGDSQLDGSLSWTLSLSAPGRLPCGELSPSRGFDASLGMCVAVATNEASLESPEPAEMGAASIGIGREEVLCRVDEFPAVELSPTNSVRVVSHSITWDDAERLWRAVAWTAGRDLLTMTSSNCRDWSSPFRILTEPGEGELGMPSYVAGGPFGYPTLERLGPRHHVFYTRETADSADRTLYHLSSEALEVWSTPKQVYNFRAADLVREPVRLISISDSELLAVYRVEETLQSSVGILRAVSHDFSDWQRTMPWPFRVRSSNPTTVDSEGLGGAVLYFSGGEGLLLAEGRPTEDYLLVSGDRVGKFELSQEVLQEADVRSFPSQQLFGGCDESGVCDPGETCSSCPGDCGCERDLLSGQCWVTEGEMTAFAPTTIAAEKRHVVIAEDTYTLRGRVHRAQSSQAADCLPYVSICRSLPQILDQGLGGEATAVELERDDASLTLFLNPGPVAEPDLSPQALLEMGSWPLLWSIASSEATLFSEWDFEFQKSGDSLTLRVWDPLGCEILSRTETIEGGSDTAIAVGAMGECSGASLTELFLLSVGEDR
jgi:hypothetical protein